MDTTDNKSKMEVMHDKLCEAAVRGSVEWLHEVVAYDEFIFEKVLMRYNNWSPLNIAISYGHVDFVKELLHLKPKLTEVLDSVGQSPLHLAVGAANLVIVKELIDAAPEMCMVCDQKGQTPIHIAAIKGNVEILEHLFQVCIAAAFTRVDRDETILHLCVRYNQLQALEVLLQLINNQEFFKSVDANGQNILQLAVSHRKREMIILLHRHIRSRPRREYGISPSKKEILMLVASIIATMAYQVMMNPPGGVWQDDSPTHNAGEAVISYTHPHSYVWLVYCSTVAFFSANAVMLTLMNESPTDVKFGRYSVYFLMCLAIGCLAATYVISSFLSSRKTRSDSTTTVVLISVIFYVITAGTILYNAYRRCAHAPV